MLHTHSIPIEGSMGRLLERAAVEDSELRSIATNKASEAGKVLTGSKIHANDGDVIVAGEIILNILGALSDTSAQIKGSHTRLGDVNVQITRAVGEHTELYELKSSWNGKVEGMQTSEIELSAIKFALTSDGYLTVTKARMQ